MDKTIASTLKRVCQNATSNATTFMNIGCSNVFDNKYFVELMNKQGVLTPDQDLYSHKRTEALLLALRLIKHCFSEKFVNGMVKMGQMEVLTGTQGRICNNCSSRNSNNILILTVVEGPDIDNIRSF